MRSLGLLILAVSACAAQPPRNVTISPISCEAMAKAYGVAAPAGFKVCAVWNSRSNSWFRCEDVDLVRLPHVFVVNVLSTRMVVISDCRRDP